MRCLFTMFAEDVELIPKSCFEDLLARIGDKPDSFVPAMEAFWRTMDEGGYEPNSMATFKRFNGSLFKSGRALPLDADGIAELRIAARRDWRDVEPAIFGTLLERALDPAERARLGAHYTPRAYVERLVIPTVIEPLRTEWETVQTAAEEKLARGKLDAARALLGDFHHKLCTVRVLDPACGTGNFLYVALELMKRLEGEVLEALEATEADVGFGFQGETVNPAQFFGMELNPRAVAIADLVLWIGYIKWQLRTSGVGAVSEPVLHAYGTIREQDAILAYDRQELLRDDQGRPLSRWDGVTTKLHPVTGEAIPDPDATRELHSYVNPRRAPWPEAEFIVGNPPFIGGKDMRAELGDGYAEACWKVRPHVPGGADFVMHFWDEAAERLARKGTKTKPNPLRRFGFITTNSITQTFSRRVVEKALGGKQPVSLVFAVADHPWLKAADKAAVRIAMTVAEKGEQEGILATVKSEDGLNTDTPRVELDKREGKITAKLTMGADLALAKPLMGNSEISSRGVVLHGPGFIVTPEQAAALGLGTAEGLDRHIREYRNGRDIAQRPRGVMVIDLFGLTPSQVQARFPRVYQHVLGAVKPERDANRDAWISKNWWIFGRPRTEFRDFSSGLPRYIATIETAKHRFFQFLDASILPDNRLVNFGLSNAASLATMSSRLHISWTLAVSSVLEDRPIYTKTAAFDPFPFPACVTEDVNPDLRARLCELGERLDAFRKERLDEHAFLTMTGLYNVLERLRELEAGADVPPLTDAERDIHEAGLVSVLKDIHDRIDRAVFKAYGWTDLGNRLVGRPGATMPSPHKGADQEAAEEELLRRLVALNLERQAEEARGLVRWLRPDYQIEKLGDKVVRPEQGTQTDADLIVVPVTEKPKWPSDAFEQIRLVRDMLSKAQTPALPEEIASVFDGRNTQKRKARVDEVLRLLAETGGARTGELDGKTRYFTAR